MSALVPMSSLGTGRHPVLGFRNVLVATDVAARGLDLKRVSLVVSYDKAVPWRFRARRWR